MQVNGGSWQHYDPGTYTTTMYTFASTTVLDGLGIWTTVHCGVDNFETVAIDLSPWRGDDVRFRFIAAAKYSDDDSGWFIDNIGLRQANFSSPGTWISDEFQLGQQDRFDYGIIDSAMDRSPNAQSIEDGSTRKSVHRSSVSSWIIMLPRASIYLHEDSTSDVSVVIHTNPVIEYKLCKSCIWYTVGRSH